MSEAYLAHSEKTLARVCSHRDFDKFADAWTDLPEAVKIGILAMVASQQ